MIKIENVTKKYRDVLAVNKLSIDINENEVFGLLGPNGAGKTTLIHIICGLLKADEGKILIKNKNSSKSTIGYCPQENIFYPKLTCIEQLLFIGRMYGVPSSQLKITASSLLEQLGLQEKSRVLARKLSGGMKKRLNLCLALIHSPDILVLDEPEAGLDPQSRILVREFIKHQSKSKTIVLSTHNMDEADRVADQVAIIDHGRLLCLDTASKLKSSIGLSNVLEIVLNKTDTPKTNSFIELLNSNSFDLKLVNQSILIKHHDLIDQIPFIKTLLKRLDINVSEIKIRESTLEDVFIHITGRRLRE